MNLTGGGAFYSQTSKSGLKDLQGVNVGSFSKGAGAKRLRILKSNVILNEVKNRRNEHKCLIKRFFEQGSQNDISCYPHPIGGRVPKAGEGLINKEILRPSAEVLSATSTTNAQNDRTHVILSKNCGVKEQSKNFGEGSRNRIKRSCSWLGKDLTLTPIPSPNGRGVNQPAITLAEILVALGVIGIIAAMTLPMLARNYQFYIRQQQFKKAYAALEIAVQKTQIDMGEGVRCYYEYRGPDMQIKVGVDRTDCNWFYTELLNNLNIVQSCKKNAFEGKCISSDLKNPAKVYAEMYNPEDKDANENYYIELCGSSSTGSLKTSSAYLTNSGFTIIPRYILSSSTNSSPIFIVDINGFKGPNKWGYDVFFLEFAKFKKYDSVFVLSGTTRCGVFESGGYYSRSFVNYLYGRDTNL